MTSTDPARDLREGFTGELILPGQPGYEEARRVFNGTIDRRPALIARCASTADVVRAVEVAREHGLLAAVRCGGHSFSGQSVCDDGIVIDLGGLKTVSIDPGARTVRAGGGVLWSELDAVTQAFGLHTPGGRMSATGIGGFTLGGGYGWSSCRYGLACDNLVSAELVLADGSVVRASERERPDLFWALRGGGGNFGVVTEFEFRLHPLGPTVLAGMALFEIERAGEVLRAWRDIADDAPDELATAFALITAPPEPFVPPAMQGQPAVGIAAMYVGAPEDGAGVIEPIRALEPAADVIAPTTYTAFQTAQDALAPDGVRSYSRGEYLHELSDAAIDAFLEHGVEGTTVGAPLSQMVVMRVGQAISAVPEDATAFSHRDARYLFHPIMGWFDPADDERLSATGRAFAAAMRTHGTGAPYLNFTPEHDRVRDGFGEEKYARLVAIKDVYDPGNLFRLNQNIRPSLPAAEPALA